MAFTCSTPRSRAWWGSRWVEWFLLRAFSFCLFSVCVRVCVCVFPFMCVSGVCVLFSHMLFFFFLLASSSEQGDVRFAEGAVLPDVIMSERRGQSQKPEELYEVIESVVPDGRYLEIFGRKNNLRNYWVTIGNEL